MRRKASVVWQGDFENGRGLITTESSALSEAHYFGARAQRTKGTNAGELIAAAHAACFSMSLANHLGNAGFTANRISTTAILTSEQLATGWTITSIELDVAAQVPNAKQGDFIKAALNAKIHCTVSRLLNANISMNARLIP
ncbi:MAG: OsmC family peroxiredoxin [Verrucomicrobiota bacterium]